MPSLWTTRTITEAHMNSMFNPPHPGLTLREDILPALHLQVGEAAAQLFMRRSRPDQASAIGVKAQLEDAIAAGKADMLVFVSVAVERRHRGFPYCRDFMS